MKTKTTSLLKSCLLLGLVFGLTATFCTSLSADQTQDPDALIKSLVLVDEGAGPVLDLVERLTKKTVLRQQNLPKVAINFNSRGPISRSEALGAVQNLLSMNGIALVDLDDRFMKAVPATEVKSQSPKFVSGSTLELNPSQVIHSKIFRLKYLTAKDAQKVIKDLGTKNVGSQVSVDKSSALLVTDSLVNLQRMERVLNEVDRPGEVSETVKFYQLQFQSADDVRARLQKMKISGLRKYLQGSVFDAESNSNQLLVVTNARNIPLIDDVVAQLDVRVAPINRSQVFKLLHAKAPDVANLLKSIIGSKKSKPKSAKSKSKDGVGRDSFLDGPFQNEPRAFEPNDKFRAVHTADGVPVPDPARAQNLPSPAQADQAVTAIASSQSESSDRNKQFSQIVTVEADERSNSIVVFGTPSDLALVRELIDQLDEVLPQVLIEVIVAEVTLSDQNVSGLSSFGISANVAQAVSGLPAGDFRINNATNSFTTTGIQTSPLTLNASLEGFELSTVFSVAQQDSNVQILQTPMVMTSHNQKGIFKSGLQVPIVDSRIDAADPSIDQRIVVKYVDIGIELEVTPLIGPDGVIEMEIKQVVQSILPGAIGPNGPTFSNRETSSFVSVADRDVLVLSGLKTQDTQYVKGKIWLFGYIPIIGDLLFSPKSKQVTNSEVVLFLRPTIVRNEKHAKKVFNESINCFTARDEISNVLLTGSYDGTCPNFANRDPGLPEEFERCKPSKSKSNKRFR